MFRTGLVAQPEIMLARSERAKRILRRFFQHLVSPLCRPAPLNPMSIAAISSAVAASALSFADDPRWRRKWARFSAPPRFVTSRDRFSDQNLVNAGDDRIGFPCGRKMLLRGNVSRGAALPGTVLAQSCLPEGAIVR